MKKSKRPKFRNVHAVLKVESSLKETKILDELKAQAEDLAGRVLGNPDLLPEIFKGISSSDPRIKFKSAKILRIVSERDPKILYSRINLFINSLDSKDNIIKWIAIDVIGNLSSVDSENKFDKIFNKFYGLLADESMITAGHVIDSSGKIARAKPYLQKKITKELMRVEKTQYKTSECRNILLGKVILSFSQYIDQVDYKEEMISLAKRQLVNSRRATRAKAEKFLRAHGNSVG
jgi:hypothetical protein